MLKGNKSDGLDHLRADLTDDIGRSKQDIQSVVGLAREETARSITAFGDSVCKWMTEIAQTQGSFMEALTRQVSSLTQSNAEKIDKIKETVDAQLKTLREDNIAQLEKMRQTVDNELHATLEKRLGESFKLVSERL